MYHQSRGGHLLNVILLVFEIHKKIKMFLVIPDSHSSHKSKQFKNERRILGICIFVYLFIYIRVCIYLYLYLHFLVDVNCIDFLLLIITVTTKVGCPGIVLPWTLSSLMKISASSWKIKITNKAAINHHFLWCSPNAWSIGNRKVPSFWFFVRTPNKKSERGKIGQRIMTIVSIVTHLFICYLLQTV